MGTYFQCRAHQLVDFDHAWLMLHSQAWFIIGLHGEYIYISFTRDWISWLYSCCKSSYISSVCRQCHVDLLKCTEQNVNYQSLTQVSQLYVHFSFCLLKVIRSWLNVVSVGYGHVICMSDATTPSQEDSLSHLLEGKYV